MAYIPGFEYDIFISYSHIDNPAISGCTSGWVDCFEELFQAKINQRVGESVAIWRDTSRLTGNYRFNEAIEKALQQSALFISLTSPASIKSDYCALERKLFAQDATQKTGTAVDGHHRLFNLILNNIPKEDWPVALGRAREETIAFPFFEATQQDKFGKPSDTSGDEFDAQLDRLAEAVRITLAALKNQSSSVPSPNEIQLSPEKSLFVAEVPDDLRKYRRKIIKSLKANDFRVITDIPPPDTAAEHDEAVIAGLKQCAVSIHLLSDNPGEEVEDDDTTTYPRRQAELALAHGENPFIWVPKDVNIASIENRDYQSFLADLENNTPRAARFRRGFSSRSDHNEIFDQVLRHMENRQTIVPPETKDCLVDYHEREDAFFVSELTNFLFEKGIRCRLVPQADSAPEKGRKIYEERIRHSSAVVILYGNVSEAWVRQRVGVGLQHYAMLTGAPPQFVVCALPPVKKPQEIRTFKDQFSSFGPFHLEDYTDGFAPDRFESLLTDMGVGGVP